MSDKLVAELAVFCICIRPRTAGVDREERSYAVKWVFLSLLLGGILPLSQWLRGNPRDAPKVWMLMGFLPFGMGPLHLFVAPISWAGWPGYVKGVEFSALDALALAVYFSLPRGGRPLPFRLSMGLYLGAVLLSTFQADVPMAALFYAWQLARMFLLYAVVAKACADERFALALLKGMVIGLCMETLLAVWERFGHGVIQAGGTFGHQNLLGMMSHFVVFPLFALLLAGNRDHLVTLGPLAGIVTAVFTASRATLGFAGIGYVGLFLLSALRKWTSRKATILMAGVMIAAVAAPIALWSLERRYAAETHAAYDERAAFTKAASMILADHPMGIGANNYVVIANTMGYNDRAGVAWTSASESANVHNVYLLVASETGYIGLAAFLLLLLRPLTTALICGWRNRNDSRGDLLLGLGSALFIVYIHSLFEWVFITYLGQYMFAFTSGLVAGLAQQLGYWKRIPAGTMGLKSEQLVRPIANTKSH